MQNYKTMTKENEQQGKRWVYNFVKRGSNPNPYATVVSIADDIYTGSPQDERNLAPDVLLKYTVSGVSKYVYVECKFHTMINDCVWICNHTQLTRYKAHHRTTPVYIALATGPQKGWISDCYLIPILKVHEHMTKRELAQYKWDWRTYPYFNVRTNKFELKTYSIY